VTKRTTNQLFALFIIILVTIVPACGGLTTDEIVDAAGGDSALTDVSADDEKTGLLAELLAETTSTGSIEGDFTSDTAALIASSVLDLPKSLAHDDTDYEVADLAKPESGPDGTGVENSRQSTDSGDADQIFNGIHKYIGMAEDFKSEAVDILVRVIPQLTAATLDEEFLLAEDALHSDDPKRVLIERGELYNWKVSLFFAETALDPEMIFRFTLAGDGVAGLILRSLQDVENSESLDYTETVPVTLAVPFNGTLTTKSLEIRLHRDFTGLREWVGNNIFDPASDDLIDLDLGAPDKVFISALLETDLGEYTIHGATYHPGWEVLRELGVEDVPGWETGRNFYMFKAKADEPAIDGTTTDDDETTDDDGTTTDDSAAATDDDGTTTDDSAAATDDDGTTTDDSAAATDDDGTTTDDPATATDDDGTTTDDPAAATEVSGAKLFLAIPLDSATDVTSVWEDDSIAVHFESAMLAVLNGEIAVEDDGLEMLQLVLDDPSIAEIRPVTGAEFGAFLDRDLSDSDDDALIQEEYLSVKSTLNPAFYTDSDGFIGTYDEAGGLYWGYDGISVSASGDTDFIATVDSLNGFDLSGIVPYIPADIVGAVISVE
jgi:hypothetical protein